MELKKEKGASFSTKFLLKSFKTPRFKKEKKEERKEKKHLEQDKKMEEGEEGKLAEAVGGVSEAEVRETDFTQIFWS